MLKHSLALVIHQCSFTMHRLWRSYDSASIDLTNCLMPQTDAKRGNASALAGNDLTRQTCIVRGARACCYDDVTGLNRFNFRQASLLVTHHSILATYFPTI